MKIYLVGGAVRDELLGLPVSERDWVVTGATPEQMLELGYRQLDADFPVFLHPETNEEYALARTEQKQGSGYKGFIIDADPSITLEQDLARRDLTINAMAIDHQGHLVDPFNGRQDLDEGRLRHVTEAFVEDPLRLLRIARFAAVLGQHGFSVSHATFKLMKQMVAAGELAELGASRLSRELFKALSAQQGYKFFKVLGKCGALDQLLPGSNRWINGEQMVHGEDSAAIQALQRVTELTDDAEIRLATVFFAAVTQAEYPLADYLPLSKNLAQLVKLLPRVEVLCSTRSAETLFDALESCGGLRQGGQLLRLLPLMSAVQPACASRADAIPGLVDRLRSIDTSDLVGQGLHGPALGQALRDRRILLVTEWLKAYSHSDE